MQLHQHRITVTFDVVSGEERPRLTEAIYLLFQQQLQTWAKDQQCLVSDVATRTQVFLPVEPA